MTEKRIVKEHNNSNIARLNRDYMSTPTRRIKVDRTQHDLRPIIDEYNRNLKRGNTKAAPISQKDFQKGLVLYVGMPPIIQKIVMLMLVVSVVFNLILSLSHRIANPNDNTIAVIYGFSCCLITAAVMHVFHKLDDL